MIRPSPADKIAQQAQQIETQAALIQTLRVKLIAERKQKAELAAEASLLRAQVAQIDAMPLHGPEIGLCGKRKG